eukprot:scaffold2767_cov177-Amphora_coffeaeformis.AAC.69
MDCHRQLQSLPTRSIVVHPSIPISQSHSNVRKAHTFFALLFGFGFLRAPEASYPPGPEVQIIFMPRPRSIVRVEGILNKYLALALNSDLSAVFIADQNDEIGHAWSALCRRASFQGKARPAAWAVSQIQ